MLIPEYAKDLPKKKVAVTDWNDLKDYENRLSIDYYKVWGEEPPV